MLNTVPEGAVWGISFLPLASLATIVLFTYQRPRLSGYVTIAAVGASFLLSLWVLDSVLAIHGHDLGFPLHEWLTVGTLQVDVGLAVDGLTAIMLVVVTGVSLMVQIYSQGYMAGDTGYSRYYAFMSLFTASMLGLVLSSSLLMVFVFWELVGLCSFLLIGFWFHKPSAARAAMKAFLVTRLGDLGFISAIVFIWTQTGTFEIRELQELALTGAIGSGVITWFAVGVFTGAMGKSAQFPLHVWLPDAMEGPTPVSALIHAATMVAAGVYLVARLFPIFEASGDTATTVAIIGGITAIVAATMGIVMTDIKRVVAYSTISQLGYMMLALGVGGYVAAVFHLMNHAFFKALLFLGSGSVNHATGTFDIRRMGGLARYMPWTFGTFVIAALSLSGIPPFSGFWSKDEILLDAWHEKPVLFWLALATAFLTALYIFRVVFLTFSGEYRAGEASEHGHDSHDAPAHPHESPGVMVAPMLILAVAAIGTGLFNIGHGVTDLLKGALPAELAEHEGPEFNAGIAIGSTAVAAAGIFVAWGIYGARLVSADALRRLFGPVHTLVANKYYLDWLYEDILVRRVFYGLVTFVLSLFDRRVVDGIVNGAGTLARYTGGRLRLLQSGQVQGYAVALGLGVVVILAGILIANP